MKSIISEEDLENFLLNGSKKLDTNLLMKGREMIFQFMGKKVIPLIGN